jgi:hypothetical protein
MDDLHFSYITKLEKKNPATDPTRGYINIYPTWLVNVSGYPLNYLTQLVHA